MIEFYDTSALMCYPDKITSDIFISEVSLQEIEKMAQSMEYSENIRNTAIDVLRVIRRVKPVVVLLEDAIKWYDDICEEPEAYYNSNRLKNRDFLSIILSAYYIKSIGDEEFTFYTESYLSYVNTRSLYFDLNTKMSCIGDENNDSILYSTQR